MIDGTVRNYFGKVRIDTGSMGAGYVLLAEDGVWGDTPIASVNVPLKDQAVSRRIAEYFAACWNEGKRDVPGGNR